MKFLTGTTKVSNFSIAVRKLCFRIKVALIILGILEAIAVWNNPVLLLKQTKAFHRYWENRSRRITYNLIKETRGSTIANMYDCGNVWSDFGHSMNKAWCDTLSIFK